MNLLKVNNLTKIYEGKVAYKALKSISMSVSEGDFVAIMGPSGSGKSTLLNIISTIDKPTSGEVMIDGKNPYKLNDQKLAKFRRSKLGFVFQDFNLIDTLTIQENIMLPLTLEGVSPREMKVKSLNIAKLLNINEILNKRSYEVSGGQAQRTAIARAVITNPKLLLADEPTGNLDSKSTKDVMNIFKTLNNERKTTILMVTHEPLVASYCKKVFIIKDGELYQEIESGGNQKLFHQEIIDSLNLLGGGESDII